MTLEPHLARIEQDSPKCLPFISKIRQLAHNFQLNELEAMISRYLGSDKEVEEDDYNR
jgi:transcriptional regulator with XRE-family HTH domain